MMTTSSAKKDTVPPSHVYTVQSYQPFLETVARGLLDAHKNDPLALADTTVLVPDSETGMALRQAFIEQMQGKPAIMPHIETPNQVDRAELRLQAAGRPALVKKLAGLPPPVSKMERQFLLAQEILKIPGMASSPQKAIALGEALGRLLDEAQRYDVSLQNMDKLVPPAFRKEWAQTAEFLKILTETWPQKLAAMGKSDPETYRQALLDIRAGFWSGGTPRPVVAIGFTARSKAMNNLLKTVAHLPQGKIILQGLDRALAPQNWDILTPVHPQYALKRLLEDIGVDRAAVQEWKAAPLAAQNHARATNPDRTNQARQNLLRETMLPAATTREWTPPPTPTSEKIASLSGHKNKDAVDIHALSGMGMITTSTQQEEASVVALRMRESLEVPGRKVAFVTEDRALARRVSARLKTWQIEVHDEAGAALSETPAGVYLLATAAMAAEKWAPVPTLEALHHPLASLGEDKDAFRRKISDLENMVYHGPRPAPGAQGAKNALKAAFNRAAKYPPHYQTPEQLKASQKELRTLVTRMEAAGKDFFDKMASAAPVPFGVMLEAHIAFAEKLACNDKETGDRRIWRDDDGVQAARFLKRLRGAAHLAPAVTGAEYTDVLQGLMRDVKVHVTKTTHPQLRIMTPAQARLLKSDIVILGGINDKVWPPSAQENPWLSPAMIRALGLPAPETVIGGAAHDFVQLASTPNVLLVRALRSGGAPTVMSPFLARMMLALRNAGLEKKIEKKTRLLDIHVAMHAPANVVPVDPPHVTPPVDKRPKKLPVTGVETLMRDPYSVYVKYVLNIRQKAPLDSSPGVADRGTFTHEALDLFMKKYPDDLPDNALQELLKIGKKSFKSRMDNPTVRAFWWPRFEQIAKWFVGFEAERRAMSKTLGTEVRGKLEFDTGDGVFTLTAIADRIDRAADDTLTLIDYKTGGVPEQKAVKLGFSPQLTLEALISFTGGFTGIDAADVGKLQYWKLSGNHKAADIKDVKADIKTLVSEARDGIEALVKAFNNPKTPYLVTPRPEWAPRYNNNRHLSRVDEWSTVKKTPVNDPAPEKKPATGKKPSAGKKFASGKRAARKRKPKP